MVYLLNTLRGPFFVVFYCQEDISCIQNKNVLETDIWLYRLWQRYMVNKEVVLLRLRKTHNCVCVKLITLCNCLCFSSSPSRFSPSLIWNIREFGVKNYFEDRRTDNTIHGFRDSVPVLKIDGCDCRFLSCHVRILEWIHTL